MDTPFRTYSAYEKELLVDVPLNGEALKKAVVKHHGNFGHTLGRIRHITVMIRIKICFIEYFLGTLIVAPILPVFQGLKSCIHFLIQITIRLYSIYQIIIMGLISSGQCGVETR